MKVKTAQAATLQMHGSAVIEHSEAVKAGVHALIPSAPVRIRLSGKAL